MANTEVLNLKLPATSDNIAEQINIDTVDNLTKIDNAIKNDRQQINTLDADKANKAWGSWITATLGSGWTGTLQYRKNDMNILQLKGTITVGTIAIWTTIAALPTGYIPKTSIPLLLYNSSAYFCAKVSLRDNGNIQVVPGLSTTDALTAGNTHQINVLISLD